MSEFEAALPSFRLVQTRHADTLTSVAARELGDANRWIELVWLNDLTYPYLTNDEAAAGPGVLLTGSKLRVPATVGVPITAADDNEGFERDCILVRKRLTVDAGGDFAVVAGTANLKQQLTHRINTPMGQARRHPQYGCRVWQLIGKVSGPLAGTLGAGYVRAALLSDYRVAQVSSSQAQVIGDRINVTAKAEAKGGGSVDVVTPNSG